MVLWHSWRQSLLAITPSSLTTLMPPRLSRRLRLLDSTPSLPSHGSSQLLVFHRRRRISVFRSVLADKADCQAEQETSCQHGTQMPHGIGSLTATLSEPFVIIEVVRRGSSSIDALTSQPRGSRLYSPTALVSLDCLSVLSSLLFTSLVSLSSSSIFFTDYFISSLWGR
jgi:hypothetical protein